MQRTLRLKLTPTPEQAAILLDTLHLHTACFNAVAAYGWEQREKNGVMLHKATYYPLREQYPTFPAQLVIAARMRATEAIKSALTRQKQGKTDPKFSSVAIEQPHSVYSCPAPDAI